MILFEIRRANDRGSMWVNPNHIISIFEKEFSLTVPTETDGIRTVTEDSFLGTAVSVHSYEWDLETKEPIASILARLHHLEGK
jgi:hypothetical protein